VASSEPAQVTQSEYSDYCSILWMGAGGILLFAGLQHFQNQFHFYLAVMSYGLTPSWASKTIAGVLPHLELLVRLQVLDLG
jgi:hypothetical protein